MENIEQIIQNSKTIKQLTRDISTIAKNSGGSSTGGSQQGKSGVTGINKVDAKIDDIKDAFANNSTVQFLKDPVGVFAKGFQGAIKPFTDIPGKIGDGLKKLNPFGKGGNKAVKLDNKVLKEIQKNTAATAKAIQKFTTIEGRRERAITEAIGEGALADELQTEEMKKLRQPLTNLTLLTKQTGDALKSGFLRLTKADKAIEKARNFLFGESLSNEEKAIQLQENLQHTNESGFYHLIEGFQKAFGIRADEDTSTGLESENIETGLNRIVNTLRDNVGKGILGIGNALKKTFQLDLRRDKKNEAADQARREAERDRLNREKKAARGTRRIGKPPGEKDEKVDKGGIFAWIKKNILGIGATALAGGATAAAGGIGAFFTGLTAIMTKVGTALPFYLKGALALSSLAAPIAAFGLAIPFLVKGLEGMTFKKIGIFAALITTVGLVAAALGALISTGIGGLALAGGIAAIAALGLALGGFGAGLALGEKGFIVLSNFFDALGNVPYLGVQILALSGLGGALAAIGGGGLLARFSSGPLDNVSEFLDKIKGNTLQSAGEGLNGLASSMERINESKINTDFAKSFKDISSYGFRRDLGKAADGFKSFLNKVGEALDKLDVSKLETLLATGDLTLQSVNAQGFAMESGQRALADNNQGAGGFVSVDNSTRSGNTNITNVSQVNPIVGDDTMAMVANTKVRHNG